MQPNPDFTSVTSPAPSIAQSRKDLLRDRPVGPGASVPGKAACDVGLRVVVPVVGRDARGRFVAGPQIAAPGWVRRVRSIAQAEAAALAPWKAGIAQVLIARGLVLAGRRPARDAEVRNDPIGGRAVGGGGAVIGAGEQRPYGRPEGGVGEVAVLAGRRAARDAEGRNDPIGGKAMGGGGSAVGGGEQRPYTRLEGGGDHAAVRAGRRAVLVVEVRNDPIGGHAMGGGGSALGDGEQRPYTRLDGGGDDAAVRPARRAVRVVEVRNDPIGGRAMGGGDDAAVRAARRAVRVMEVRNDPIGGRATGGGGLRSAQVSNTLYAARGCIRGKRVPVVVPAPMWRGGRGTRWLEPLQHSMTGYRRRGKIRDWRRCAKTPRVAGRCR